MEFDVALDGSIFLIELAGKIKRIEPASGESTLLADIQVNTEQENGLIGLALAPDFSSNGWIYLQYSPLDFPGQRISRFFFQDGALDLQSEQRLVQYEEQRRECCHHAGSLEFGPDGCLYIATGDNTNPFQDSDGYAPIDERPDREPWDAQRSSANTRSYNGKILRIKPEPDGSYSIPDGNLFPADGSVGLPEIYVMGCRNPWRISCDAKTGYLYWGDVGPDAGRDGPRGPRGYDELNQARRAGNFGWPYFIADNQAYYRYDFTTQTVGPAYSPALPINESSNNTGARELPPAQPALIYYPSAPFEHFPEVGSGGRTACAGPVYYAVDSQSHPNCFPAVYDRTLFAFEWSRNWILCVHLDENHQIQRLDRFLPDQEWTRPIQLKFDSGGSLYVLLYGETWGVNPDAELVRLDYIRGNRTPQAVATADQTSGKDPLRVRLSAGKSSDADGDSLSYEWTVSRSENRSRDGESEPSEATDVLSDATQSVREPVSDISIWKMEGIEPETTFDQPGIYEVVLKVTDTANASDQDKINIIVGNAPPNIRFLEPQPYSFFEPGQAISYSLEITDLEDGSSNSDLVYESDHLDELEPSAVQRTYVQLTPVGLDGKSLSGANEPVGLQLIRKSGCFNCHTTNLPLVGPPFQVIAAKYRDQAQHVDVAASRVEQGSVGVWNKVPMLSHKHLPHADIRLMVEYVLSMQPDSDLISAAGLNNQLTTSPEMETILLEASYTDKGFGEVPALSSTTSVLLRSRKLQAESAIEFKGTSIHNSARADKGRFMGSIEHNGFLKFPQIPLANLGGIRVSVASAGAGGQIAIRQGSVTGEELASIRVIPNGDWEQFHSQVASIGRSEGIHDIYLVFINAENRSGLLNVDWIEFLPATMVEP